MGYNGNNRGYSRRRSGHRGAYRSGERIMGGVFKGLLGLGALAVNEAAKSAQNNPQPNDEQQGEQQGLGCLIPATLILVPLNVVGLMLGGLPIIGVAIVAILVMLLYGVFDGCALAIKKLPTYAKVPFWFILVAFCLICSYWILDVDNIFPSFAIDITGNQVLCDPNWLDVKLWLLGGAFPLTACFIGYFSGIHKAKKKDKIVNK